MSTFPDRVAEALVGVIKEQMFRNGVRSSRELARLTDHTSPFVSERLDGGSVKTGRRVILTVRDLEEFAGALGTTGSVLLAAAEDAIATVDAEVAVADLPTLAEQRALKRAQSPGVQKTAARSRKPRPE